MCVCVLMLFLDALPCVCTLCVICWCLFHTSVCVYTHIFLCVPSLFTHITQAVCQRTTWESTENWKAQANIAKSERRTRWQPLRLMGKQLPATALPQGQHHVGEVVIIGLFWGLANCRASEWIQLVWAGCSKNTQLSTHLKPYEHTHKHTHWWREVCEWCKECGAVSVHSLSLYIIISVCIGIMCAPWITHPIIICYVSIYLCY